MCIKKIRSGLGHHDSIIKRTYNALIVTARNNLNTKDINIYVAEEIASQHAASTLDFSSSLNQIHPNLPTTFWISQVNENLSNMEVGRCLPSLQASFDTVRLPMATPLNLESYLSYKYHYSDKNKSMHIIHIYRIARTLFQIAFQRKTIPNTLYPSFFTFNFSI